MIQSVLARAQPDMVQMKPYPHIVLNDALPGSLYEQLAAEYPTLDLFTCGRPYRENRPMFYKAANILQRNEVSELWRGFTAYHSSAAFLAEVLRVFGHCVNQIYGHINWRSVQTGVRGIDTHEKKDILLDAQFGINTPVVGEPSSVRGMHVDDSLKLYNGLLYFRHPDDHSEGGDFMMYRKKGAGWRQVVRVPYSTNVLVFFVNCQHAVHAVAPRSASPYCRRYMSYAGEYREKLFVEIKLPDRTAA